MNSRRFACSIPVLVLAASVASGQPYRYEMTLMPDGYRLEDVNNNGAAVGWEQPSGQKARSFVWTEADGFFWVNSPETPAENVRFKGISDAGLVAATASRDMGGAFPYARAHTYDRVSGEWNMIHPWAGCSSEMQDMSPNGKFCGEVQHLRTSGSCGSQFSEGEAFAGEGTTASTIGLISQYPDWAHAINNNGDVCGEGYLADGSSVRGTYRPAGGSISALPSLGGDYAFAYGLNDDDRICGYAERGATGDWVAVVWKRISGVWQIEELDEASISSLARDVNNHDQVVGWNWDQSLEQVRATMWWAEESWDLTTLVNNPQGVVEDALAISETGWIVGWARVNGDRRGCILKPVDRDTDGDGLLDSWETLGADVNGDGTIDLDLPAMGADPNHKDLFLEIDRMVGVPFWQSAVDAVEAAFDAAPVENPDGSCGIKAHLIVDEADIPFLDSWGNDFVTYGSSKAIHLGTPAERSDPNWPNIRAAREQAFRYCAVINKISSGSVGLAERPGDDMMVAYGGYGAANEDNFAATMMHELGHMLNLGHGGGDSKNFKPNYISCMNYNFDVLFVANEGGVTLDYSREALADLDESNLDETSGMPNGTIYTDILTLLGQPKIGGGRDTAWVQMGTPNFDWNADGSQTTGAVADLNWMPSNYPGDAANESPGDLLKGANDWDLVVLPIGVNGPYEDSMHIPPPFDEQTIAEKEWLAANVPPVPGKCDADLNGDGIADNGDISAFIGLFLAQDVAVDFNGDGVLDNADIGEFVALFLSGC